MNQEANAYYAIVNLIDWLVNLEDDKKKITKDVVYILKQIETRSDIHPEDVGDANDCGSCESWEDVIDGFAHLTEIGERVPV